MAADKAPLPAPSVVQDVPLDALLVRPLQRSCRPRPPSEPPLQSLRTSTGESVSAAVTAVAAEVRENVRLRRASWCATLSAQRGGHCSHVFPLCRLCATGGVVGSYVHGGAAGVPIGRMGSIVVVEPGALFAARRVRTASLTAPAHPRGWLHPQR